MSAEVADAEEGAGIETAAAAFAVLEERRHAAANAIPAQAAKGQMTRLLLM